MPKNKKSTRPFCKPNSHSPRLKIECDWTDVKNGYVYLRVLKICRWCGKRKTIKVNLTLQQMDQITNFSLKDY